MWPYIIKVNTRALLLLTLIFGSIILFWYYLLIGSKDQLTTSWLTSGNVDLKKLLIAGVIASVRGGQEVVRIRESNDLNQRSKGKTKEGVMDVLTQGDLSSHTVMVHSLSAAFPGLRIISEEHSSEEDNNNIEIIPIHVSDELLSDQRFAKLPFGLEIPLGELTVWVDPLDATKEYSEGLTQYVTTMVCVARNGEPIIGIIHKPFNTETYWGWKGKGISDNIETALNSHKKTNDTFRAIVSRSHAGSVDTFIKSSLSSEYKNLEVISAAGSGYKTIELIEGRADTYVHKTFIKKWDTCAPNAILNAINAKMTSIDGKAIKYGFDDEVAINNGLLASVGEDHQKLIELFQKFKQ